MWVSDSCHCENLATNTTSNTNNLTHFPLRSTQSGALQNLSASVWRDAEPVLEQGLPDASPWHLS